MATIKLPGLIDPHVHLREPGATQKEDFYTGTSAALAGGYTTILDMPNNKVPITTMERLEEKISLAKAKIVCDVGFHFGSLGDNLDEFAKAQDKVMGLKLYLNETTGNFLIDREKVEAIFQAWNGVGPILLHAEDDAVAFVIEVVKKTRKKAHFCHISTQNDLALISRAKQEGLPITCGVTPHHLFLTEADSKTLGPYGKMKPYLKSREDVDFLWKNLKDIDVIESDHAPHTKEEKEGETVPFGVPGLETTLPLLLTAVSEKRFTIQDLRRMCFENPKKIFNIKADPETYIEVDLDKSYTIHNQFLLTKCGWTPFDGWSVKGKIERVFIRGTKVFEDGKVLVEPGFGKILTPNL